MCASSLNKPSSQEGLKPVAFGRVIDGRAVTVSLTRSPANDEPLYAAPHPSFNDAIEADALWAALKEGCAASRDKSQVMALVMVRKEDIEAAVRALAPHISPFRTGDRVKHTGRDEDGTVTILENGNVQVLFDKPNSRGRPSIGIYDANWFKLNPNGLRALKLPDYRGGDSEKTAESEHSPSTREG